MTIRKLLLAATAARPPRTTAATLDPLEGFGGPHRPAVELSGWIGQPVHLTVPGSA